MASWKKVIVSGSSAQLTAITASSSIIIDSNQQISSSANQTFLSGSFSGSFTGVATSASYVSGSVFTSTNPALTASYAIYAASAGASGTPSSLTYGAGLTGSSLYFDGNSPVTFSINTGSTNLTASRVLKWNSGGTGFASSTISDDGITVATTVNFTVSGSTILGDASGDTITLNGSSISVPNIGVGTTDTVITKESSNALSSRTIDTRVWGSNSNLITGSGTSGQVAYFNDTKGITGTSGFTFGSSTLTVPNLTVTGTASFQETTNLVVADRFILLNSGSGASPYDGGIVVQQATQGVGEVLGWDFETSRWAVTSSFTANSNTFTPDAFMAVAISGSANTPSPAARYNKGGNIYVSSGDESIWIYS